MYCYCYHLLLQQHSEHETGQSVQISLQELHETTGQSMKYEERCSVGHCEMYSMLVESATAVLWRLLDDKSQVNKMVIEAVSIKFVYHTYVYLCLCVLLFSH